MDRFELRYQDYSLSEDQQTVRDAFRDFFTSESPSSRVRAAEPTGFDERLWRQLSEMGAASMSLPEAVGGDDATLLDLLLVAEELGRALAPVPCIEQAVSARALHAIGAPSDLLAAAADGSSVCALAPEPVGRGARQLVPGGAVAQNVLALDGDALVLVHSDEPPAHVPNQGRTPLAWWDLAGGQRRELARGAHAVEVYERAQAEWKLLMASALVGLTEQALHIAVEFAKTRETMGVVIGSLQGVAFPLADIAIGIAGARNLTRRAAWYLENEPGVRPDLVPAAYAYAAQVATHGATTAQHTQGGLGFTTEADASLYFLRAKGWSVLFGDPVKDIAAAGRLLADELPSQTAPVLAAATG
ncbi:MAG: Acyl-CoA dehydrogenase [Frankiales bacterium]|nr:Acyl-CoA dehydrogenase [Frankiales bacterium]